VIRQSALKATIAVVAILGASATVGQPPKPAANSLLVALENSLVELIARAEPSVVAISRTSPPREPALIERSLGNAFDDFRPSGDSGATTTVGAGVIIDRSGLVLTQYLAVREGDQHEITTTDGHTYSATIRGADPRSGLAVLVIDPKQALTEKSKSSSAHGSFPALRLGQGEDLRKGRFVVAIGNPYSIVADGQPSASWGTVTNLAQKAPAGVDLNNAPGPANDYRTTLHHLGTLIQTDAKLGWNAGGAALVDLNGDLVGITTTASEIAGHEQPAGYAIPINATIRRVIDTLKQGREVEYGMIGVSFGQALVTGPTSSVPTLSMVQVLPGSPASQAGLTSGDIITAVNNRSVRDIDSVQLAISELPPETVMAIEYVRAGKPATASVKLAKLAVPGKKIVSTRRERWQGMTVDFATALDAASLLQAVSGDGYDPEGCVLVLDVEEGSVAWNGGVRRGMFISHIGGERVKNPAEFYNAAHKLGDKFDIRLAKPQASDAAK